MFRLFLLVGLAAGLAVLFPLLYEKNPELFDILPRSSKEASAPAPMIAAVQPRQQRQADLLEGRRVLLASDRRGHFIGEFRMNGYRVEAMVDTGATLVAMNASMARRIGLRLTPSDFVHAVDTANGRAHAAVANLERLEIGRIMVEDVEIVVLDDQALEGILIGMSFLNRLRRYSVEAGSLVLEQ